MNFEKSLWLQDYNIKPFERLSSDIEADVVVIGAGLCGLLTAYLLKDTGYKIVVVDAAKVASGTSANNTGKITAQHGLIYKKLYDKDQNIARLYKKVCSEAINDYKRIIEENGIDCDYRECDAVVYSKDEEYAQKILEEYEIAIQLGFEAYMTDNIELNINAVNALGYKKQATFHPVKFMNHIVKILLNSGVSIYENTTVIDVDDNIVETESGFEIKATNIVMATHFPFFKLKGLYPVKMIQERSYIVALSGISNEIKNMYIDAFDYGYSFKQHGEYLLVCGQDHKTGEDNGIDRFNALIEYAISIWPQAYVAYKWAAQDCMTIDDLPYIGRYSAGMPNCFVATGFKKWGINLSMVAANIIKDMILNRVNAESEIFSPSRLKLNSKLFEFAADSGSTFIRGRNSILGTKIVQSLKKGEGVVIQHKSTNLAIYRGEDDKLTCISALCSHLGCVVKFNKSEKTWDCPCHGSRFDINGNVIEGPATEPLKKYF